MNIKLIILYFNFAQLCNVGGLGNKVGCLKTKMMTLWTIKINKNKYEMIN